MLKQGQKHTKKWRFTDIYGWAIPTEKFLHKYKVVLDFHAENQLSKAVGSTLCSQLFLSFNMVIRVPSPFGGVSFLTFCNFKLFFSFWILRGHFWVWFLSFENSESCFVISGHIWGGSVFWHFVIWSFFSVFGF